MSLLTDLLSAWREAPNSQLADFIVAVAARETTQVDDASFLEVAARKRPEDLSALLAHPLGRSNEVMRRRVMALQHFDADPRLDRFVANLYARPPLTSSNTRSSWTQVRVLAARIRDVKALEVLRAAYDDATGNRSWDTFVRQQLERVFVEVGPLTESPLSAEVHALLEALELPPAPTAAPPPPSWEEMEAAFLEDPSNDALRTVTMDALLEVDHPRARLMLMQREGASAEAIAKFTRRHAKVLLGPLAKVLKPGCEYAQGWLCNCELKTGGTTAQRFEADDTAGHRYWATVERLAGPGDGRITAHPVMKSLRTLVNSDFDVESGALPKLTGVLARAVNSAQALRWADLALLPSLEDLQVIIAPLDAVLLVERAKTLRRLRVDFHAAFPRDVVGQMQTLLLANTPELTFGFRLGPLGPLGEQTLLCRFEREGAALGASVIIAPGLEQRFIRRAVSEAGVLVRFARQVGAVSVNFDSGGLDDFDEEAAVRASRE